MKDTKNKAKRAQTSLVALALAMTMASQMNVSVYAEDSADEPKTEIKNTTESTEETTEDTFGTQTDGIVLLGTNNAGSFNVTGGTSGTEWTYDESAETLTFNASGTYTVTGDGLQTSEKIVVADNFNGTITLENINIEADCAFEVKNTATLTLMLNGDNQLTSTASAGLLFADATTGSLTIDSQTGGSLTATGSTKGAGIGGGSYGDGNNITINGGTVTATSEKMGAGIGGGDEGSANNINVIGGTVEATSRFGAGIGGGREGSANNITVNGGTVEATSTYGAGIGSGEDGDANNITINGGTVTASSDSGAGIGSGLDGYASNITIKGGTVIASSDSGAGIGDGHAGSANNITINGGTVTASSDSGAGIGSGSDGYASNITINGGTVTATSDWGAGIGGGWDVSASNITISGGTVTATSDWGAGIGSGRSAGASNNITIDGGSVKASGMGADPTDGSGNPVYLLKLENQSGVNEVTVDKKVFTRQGDHPDGDGAFYLYLTGQDHTITTDVWMYDVKWNGQNNGFDIPDSPSPIVTIDSVTASSITVKELEQQDIYGTAEYSLDEQTWQASNVFTGLTANTEYTVYARYKGNDTYNPSEAGSVTVTTMKKDGKTLLEEKAPANLSGVYGQKLSDVSLTDDWTWVNKDTALSTAVSSYSARFNTRGYEDEYDFTGVSGYDSTNHYVELNLTVNVSKADSTVTINTSSLDKEYDGTAVSNPDIEKTGSTKDVAFIWYQKDGNDWKELSSAPVNVGNYKVVASVEGDDNYNESSAELEFTIKKAVPQFEVPTNLTIEQGKTLSTVKLPKGFTWKDETQKADKLGKQTFKAIYTPEDTDNYQTVETDITVNVVAKTSSKDENKDSKADGTNTSTQTNQMAWISFMMSSALLASVLSVLKLRKRN